MEVLHNPIKKEDLESFTTFQLKVWSILESLLQNLLSDKLSENSVIELGDLGIDVFLRLRIDYFILYISIQKNNLILNSEHFDIYVYPETKMSKIESLLKQVLLGEYTIELGYNARKKLVYTELVLDDAHLKEFNESHNLGFFKNKIVNSNKVHGMKLINFGDS